MAFLGKPADPARRMFRRLASEERGVALVMALIAMLVLSTLTASVLLTVSVDQQSSYKTSESDKAFDLAEEGIAYAEGRLYTATNYGNQNNVPDTNLTQDGGTIEYFGTLSSNVWTLTGKGTYAGVLRVVTVQALQPSIAGPQNSTPWNYFYVKGGITCLSLGGNGSVNIPIYTGGDMCLNGNTSFTGADLEVGGNLTLVGGNSRIGTSGQPISKMNVGATCSPAAACAADTSPFFVSSPGVGNNVPVITKPVVDFPTYYASSNPGPATGNGCGTGSSGVPSNLFDNDTTMNLSDGNINLFPSSNYDCKGTNGELIWNASTKTLTIKQIGTNVPQFYFDGSLSLSGNTSYIYQGRGEFFFTGTVTMSGKSSICGIANCTSQWDNNTNQLFIFADCWKDAAGDQTNILNGDPYCVDLQGQNTLQADLWVGTDYHSGGQANDTGPVITNTASIAGNPAQLIPLHNVPANLPGSQTTIETAPGAPYNWSG